MVTQCNSEINDRNSKPSDGFDSRYPPTTQKKHKNSGRIVIVAYLRQVAELVQKAVQHLMCILLAIALELGVHAPVWVKVIIGRISKSKTELKIF